MSALVEVYEWETRRRLVQATQCRVPRVGEFVHVEYEHGGPVGWFQVMAIVQRFGDRSAPKTLVWVKLLAARPVPLAEGEAPNVEA